MSYFTTGFVTSVYKLSNQRNAVHAGKCPPPLLREEVAASDLVRRVLMAPLTWEWKLNFILCFLRLETFYYY